MENFDDYKLSGVENRFWEVENEVYGDLAPIPTQRQNKRYAPHRTPHPSDTKGVLLKELLSNENCNYQGYGEFPTRLLEWYKDQNSGNSIFRRRQQKMIFK